MILYCIILYYIILCYIILYYNYNFLDIIYYSIIDCSERVCGWDQSRFSGILSLGKDQETPSSTNLAISLTLEP